MAKANKRGVNFDKNSVPGLATADRQLKVIGARMRGNDFTKLRYRRELFSLVPWYGVPQLWITVNPNDVDSPFLMTLCGQPIDMAWKDEQIQAAMPEFNKRCALIAANPAKSCEFFKLVVDAVNDCLFGFEQHLDPPHRRLGVVGTVQCRYGIVEFQGRGVQHIHNLVHLRYPIAPDGLYSKLTSANPAFKTTFLKYLDSYICEVLSPHGSNPEKPRQLFRYDPAFIAPGLPTIQGKLQELKDPRPLTEDDPAVIKLFKDEILASDLGAFSLTRADQEEIDTDEHKTPQAALRRSTRLSHSSTASHATPMFDTDHDQFSFDTPSSVPMTDIDQDQHDKRSCSSSSASSNNSSPSETKTSVGPEKSSRRARRVCSLNN